MIVLSRSKKDQLGDFEHDAVQSLFPRGKFSISTSTTFVGKETLHFEEKQYVDMAVEKRISEFATGRHCARDALKKIGYAPVAIHRDRCGAPVWPKGLVGSISHAGSSAVAVVANGSTVASIGVDVERMDTGVGEGAWDLIFDEIERDRLKKIDISKRLKYSYSMFSAKESVYKCLCPHMSNYKKFWLGDIHVDVNLEAGSFKAILAGKRMCPLFGHVNVGLGYVYTGIWLTHQSLAETVSVY